MFPIGTMCEDGQTENLLNHVIFSKARLNDGSNIHQYIFNNNMFGDFYFDFVYKYDFDDNVKLF